MDVQNYYKLLGVERHATQFQIETAFEQQKALHEASQISTEQWQLIREVYHILSDPEHRLLYDEVLKQNMTQPPPPEPEPNKSAPSSKQPNLYDNYRRKQHQDPSATPAWLVEYRKKQQDTANIQEAKTTVRKTPAPQRVSVQRQSTSTTQARSQSPKLEAPAARYQPPPPRPTRSSNRPFGIRSGVGIAIAFIAFFIQLISWVDWDLDDNQSNYTFPTYNFRYATTDYSYSGSFSTRSNSSHSATWTAMARSYDSANSGIFRSTLNLAYATHTPTHVRTGSSNALLPGTTHRSILERCQVINNSTEPVPIYRERSLNSIRVDTFAVGKTLFVYRDTTEPDWLQIAEEQGVDIHLEVDNESLNITNTYIYAEDVKLEFCINGN